jgi:methyl halide transferase
MKLSLIVTLPTTTRELLRTTSWNTIHHLNRFVSVSRTRYGGSAAQTTLTNPTLLRLQQQQPRRGRRSFSLSDKNLNIEVNKSSNEEQVQKMRQQFKNDDQTTAETVVSLQQQQHDERQNTWDTLWQENITPWDLGTPTPVLISELELHWNRNSQKSMDNTEFIDVHNNGKTTTATNTNTTFRSLIPGCGGGYDLITLALHHQKWITTTSAITTIIESSTNNNDNNNNNSSLRQHTIFYSEVVVVGLDISETSLLGRASNVIASSVTKDQLQTNTRIDLVHGDFFNDPKHWKVIKSFHTLKQPGEEEQDIQSTITFDFIFDYTFFCAIHPSMRLGWGKRMASLLTPNTGRLLTIIFPVIPNHNHPLEGPPYPVTVDDYRTVLEPYGVIMDQSTVNSNSNDSEVLISTTPVRVNPNTVLPRVGKELVCWWIRKERG